MNHVRRGYYPTEPENIDHILRGIRFPPGVITNLLDPCCGCGKALRQMAQSNHCYGYGVELDEARAEEAQTRLHRVGMGSYFHSRISNEAFHRWRIPNVQANCDFGAATSAQERPRRRSAAVAFAVG